MNEPSEHNMQALHLVFQSFIHPTRPAISAIWFFLVSTPIAHLHRPITFYITSGLQVLSLLLTNTFYALAILGTLTRKQSNEVSKEKRLPLQLCNLAPNLYNLHVCLPALIMHVASASVTSLLAL